MANPSAVVRRWFEEVWNEGKESTIDELYSSQAVAHGLPGSALKGPAGFKPFFAQFRAAFPDIHVEVTQCVCEGEMCVVHCVVTGTHTGAGLGAPTHRPVRFTGMTMARVAGGQIQEGWNEFDFLRMYQQLGIEPPALV
jgi:steroid delta-isomerase-like uncharacterized protein